MREEDGTVVSPDCFMEAARKSRVYGHLTLFMIDAALRCIEQSGVACTVNLSTEDIIGENRSRSPSAKPIFKHLHPLRRESVGFDPRFTKLYLSYTRLNHRLTSELLELYGIQRKAHLML